MGMPILKSDAEAAHKDLIMDLLHATKQLCHEHMQGIFHHLGYTAPEQENLFDEWVTSRVECIEWARALAVVMADRELAGLPKREKDKDAVLEAATRLRSVAKRIRVRGLGRWGDNDAVMGGMDGQSESEGESEDEDADDGGSEDDIRADGVGDGRSRKQKKAARHVQLKRASHWQRVAFVGMRWDDV